MHLSILLLQQENEEVRKTLDRDGWHLQADHDTGGMRARHPHVPDQKVARRRLNDLGLLTSRQCRIEFLP
jgi:hypothetical protein